jgi:hypothetical protein
MAASRSHSSRTLHAVRPGDHRFGYVYAFGYRAWRFS